MLQGPCLGVLLCYGSSAASDVHCPTPCSSRWSSRWSRNASTTATQHSPIFLHSSIVDFSQFWMPQLVLIRRSSRHEHVTPLLRDLHWLQSRERIDFKLAVLVYRCLHGLAPRYLSDHFQRVASYNRRRLRSSSSSLLIRPTRLITVGDRAFPVSGSRLWNSLYRTSSHQLRLSLFSGINSKLIWTSRSFSRVDWCLYTV